MASYPSAPGLYPGTEYPGRLVGAEPEEPPPPPPAAAFPDVPAVSSPTMSARWSFVIGPAQGGYEWEVANAKARRATFRRRAPSEASFTIDGNDPIAGRITDLATDLHLLRDRGDGLREPLYRGRIAGVSDELTETGHAVSVPSMDYREVLQRRHLLNGSQVVWNGYDQLTIMNGLVQQAQSRPGGDYGISFEHPYPGSYIYRDRTYEVGDSIGQRIQELSEVENGFDWDILPDGPSGLALRGWYPQRGTDRGVILEYGGLVRALQRNVDVSDYANSVRVTGQPAEGSSTPPTPAEGAAEGLGDPLQFPQGRWDKVIGTSIVLPATLAERRTWLLDHHQVIRPAYTVQLKRGAWRGPDHIWLGDPCRIVIMSGRLRVDTSLRVEEVSIAIGDSGSEDVTLTLGAPRPNFARRSAANERRIAELERR